MPDVLVVGSVAAVAVAAVAVGEVDVARLVLPRDSELVFELAEFA